MQPIITGFAIQFIIAIFAGDAVISRTGKNLVPPGAARKTIGASATIQPILTIAAEQGFRCVARKQGVVTISAISRAKNEAKPAIQQVIAGAEAD